MSFGAMICLACLIDLAFGWPDWLYRRIGHPVTWIGAMISRLEIRLNQGDRRAQFRGGIQITLGVVTLVAVLAWGLQNALPAGWGGIVLGAVLAWPWLALRSMYSHVAAVSRPLIACDLAQARQAVSMIVGRDPTQLEEAGVARAALESLAENTSDGIIAPVFWGVVAGLPGLAAYKAINTLDSMIGHKSEQYHYFGTFAARLDDVVNWIPARLSGLLFALVSGRFGAAWRVMARDARHHRSPNAGWPEGAMAGALGVRLSGPRIYGAHISQEPWLNGMAPDPSALHLRAGLRLYARAMVALVMILAGLAVLGA